MKVRNFSNHVSFQGPQYFLALVFSLPLTLPAASNPESSGDYSESLIVRSVGDFRRICDAVVSDNVDANSKMNAALCVSYLKGVVDGFASTLSLQAELDTARSEGVSCADGAARINEDEALHK